MIDALISNKANFIFFLSCYLIGSAPFGYIFYNIIKKDDIRKYGSGNIGATNVNRLIGRKFGILTLILDIIKTFFPCLIMHKYFGTEVGVICGFFAILGHIFPVWLKFKGGKGVASYIGFMLATSWPLCIILVSCWLIVVKIFKYSAVAAILSILITLITFKIILIIQFNYNTLLWVKGDPIEFQFTVLASIIILIKHYTNVINILKK